MLDVQSFTARVYRSYEPKQALSLAQIKFLIMAMVEFLINCLAVSSIFPTHHMCDEMFTEIFYVDENCNILTFGDYSSPQDTKPAPEE